MYARLKEDHFHRVHFHRKDTLMIGRLAEYVRERVQEGDFREMAYRTMIYAYQAMISNLVIYKNILNEMDFVSIDELSRDCARIFLEGVLISPDAVPASAARKRKGYPSVAKVEDAADPRRRG